MAYQHFRPTPALAPYIDCYWIIRAPAPRDAIPTARMPADSRPTILLNFVGETRMLASDGTVHHVDVGAELLGVHNQSYTLEHEDATYLVAVQFRPGGFAAFMPYGVHELAEQTMPLDLLWGSAGKLLAEQLEGAASDVDRIAVYERLLQSRIAEMPHQVRIQYTLRQIEAARGTVAVDWLAEQVNLSQKQFERLFNRAVGMMPKRYIRLARFQKMVHWLQRNSGVINWAAVAAEFGYYDHSHLAKDFQAFAATTPSDFAAATAGIVEVSYGGESYERV